PLREVELEACVEEAGEHQDIGTQGVMAGQNARLITPSDANDAPVAVCVCQVNQVDWFRLSHSAPPLELALRVACILSGGRAVYSWEPRCLRLPEELRG